MRTWVLLSTGLWLSALACTGGEPAVQPGQIGWACPNDNNCALGLRCIDGACAEPVDAPDAGVIVDAGPDDTGPVDAGPLDTGEPQDAAEPVDGGPIDGGPIDMGCDVPATLTEIASQVFGEDRAPHCNQAACHGESAAGGVRLTPPLVDLHATLLGPTRDPQAPERNLVVPGDPSQSRLYVIMSQPDPAGQGGPMPPNGLVDACSLEAVRNWIADGALQN